LPEEEPKEGRFINESHGAKRRVGWRPNKAGKINTEICLKILDAADDSPYVLGGHGVIRSGEGALRVIMKGITVQRFALLRRQLF
jgi:hypothetical protein